MFTKTIYVCLLKKSIELYHSTINFAVFFNFSPDFINVIETADGMLVTKSMLQTSCLITEIYTRRSPLVLNKPFIYQVLKIFSHILCDDWQKYSCRTFLFNTFFQLRDIQYSSKCRSIGVLGEEGLKLVWWCRASARPTFQSSVALYNHAHWPRIITCSSGMVYFRNRWHMTVIIIMTKICIIQNLLTKQHLYGRHHYRSMIWVNANIGIPESSKRR